MSADEAVQDCLRALREVRAELADLRQQLAAEVRTRRLVVMDEAGAEVIVGQSRNGSNSLSVVWGPEDDEVSVILEAGAAGSESDLGTELASGTLALSARGMIVANVSAISIDDDHPRSPGQAVGQIWIDQYAVGEGCRREYEHHMRIGPDAVRTGRVAWNPDAYALFDYRPT